MKIGINIDGQFNDMTGIQHCLDALIQALYSNQEENQGLHDIWAFASFLPSESFIEDIAKQKTGTFLWRTLPHAKFDVNNTDPTILPPGFQREHPWLTMKIREQERKVFSKRHNGPEMRASRYDVFHNTEPGTLGYLNYKPKKQVATLYDAAVIRFPHAYPPPTTEAWLGYWDYARNKCDHYIAISEFAKSECVDCFGLDPDRFTVAPIAARASTQHMPDGEERREHLEKWELNDAPFVLYTGTLEPRKNLPRLIRAFADVIKQNPSLPHKLVLAGGNWSRLDIDLRLQAIESGLAGRVVTTGYVSNDELNALMSACHVFSYVSEYEGFGMPPLEAMTCGAPVVVSNDTSLPEVVGKVGLQVCPQKKDEISAALYTLMSDETENQRQRKLSLARAQEFTWERTAKLTMEAYEKTAAS